MKIFLVLHPSGNLAIPDAKTWQYNLYEPMLDLGHEVYFFNLADFCKKYKVRFRSKKYKELLSNILSQSVRDEYKQNGIDLFFSYLTDLDIEKQAILSIRELGIPTYNFSCNNTHQFDLLKTISPVFDFNLHAEKDAAEKFRSVLANPIWFQMSANPKYYYPGEFQYEYDVSFVGMNYARRAYYIEKLMNSGIDVHCFGPKWTISSQATKTKKEIKRYIFLARGMTARSYRKRYELSSWVTEYDYGKKLLHKFKDNFHSPLGDQEMVELFSKSRINLGFLEVYSTDNQGNTIVQQHLHLREFEVPMSGGLYCTNYSDELAEHFIPDREVIVFRNEHELTDKIRYYLDHPSHADRIRKAGYKRALNEHTCQKRLESLFNLRQ